MFIVSLQYNCEFNEIEQHQHEHQAFLNAEYERGTLLASGRSQPRKSGIFLAKASSAQALEAILENDPFKQHGLAEYQITEFRPSRVAPQLAGLPD